MTMSPTNQRNRFLLPWAGVLFKALGTGLLALVAIGCPGSSGDGSGNTTPPVVTAMSEAEPNNSLGTANPVGTPIATITGTLSNINDVDYFAITVPARTMLRVNMAGPMNMDWDLYLEDPTGEVAAYSINDGTANESLAFPNTRSTSWQVFVSVEAYAGTSASPYTLSLSYQPVVDAALNVVTQPQGATVALSQPVQLSIGVAGGQPHYTFVWRRNGTTVATGNFGYLYLSSAQASDSGSYQVTVTDALGQSVTSATAILTVTGGSPVSITSFTASPTTITAGQSATLTPIFTNATSASINNGVGIVSSGVGYIVTPAATTTYTLAANGTGGPVTRTATVTVNPVTPVSITSFTASPSAITVGQSTTLTPVFVNATSASINNGVGAVISGAAYTVSPTATTTYTLSVSGTGGPLTSTLTVTVNPLTTATVEGNVVDAPLVGAIVEFFALNANGAPGQLLGATVTDNNGNYQVNLAPAPITPVLAVARGGAYLDEATGVVVPLAVGDTLEAVLPVGTTRATVTPLTSMAAARAQFLASTGTPLGLAVTSSNIGVAQQYNIADILGAAPNAATNAAAMQAATLSDRNYSLVLAGISQEASSLNVRAIDLARALALDARDGILNGLNGLAPIQIPRIGGGFVILTAAMGTIDLGAAINTFIASILNRTNLVMFSIASGPVQIGVNLAGLLYTTSTVLPTWTANQFGSATLSAAGGVPPYQYVLRAGAPPPGIGLANNGVISGFAPVLPGGTTMSISAPFTVTVTDAALARVDLELRVTIIAPGPTVASVAGATMTQFQSGAVQVATGLGGTPPLYFAMDSFAFGTTPLGTVLLTTGFVQGTPGVGQVGFHAFRVKVIDSIGATSSTMTGVTVNAPNPFRGTISGTWAGVAPIAGTGAQSTPVSGTCAIVIAADGSVTGSYSGDASGLIAGQVNNSGAYTAAAGGGSNGVSWSGTITKSGSTLSASGTWSSPEASGGWTGTGAAAN